MFPTRDQGGFGVDLSPHQLAKARQRVPSATFILGDVLDVNLSLRSYDLVTAFWAAYCYLRSDQRIASLIARAARCVRRGGALYLATLLPADVESFNRSQYAERTGFRVEPLAPDYGWWQYTDVGGTHIMRSPELSFFTDILKRIFQRCRNSARWRFYDTSCRQRQNRRERCGLRLTLHSRRLLHCGALGGCGRPALTARPIFNT